MSGSCGPSNPLRFLCSSVLQRFAPSITGSRAITRFFGPCLSVVRFCFFRLLHLSLAVSDNSVRCCKQTTYVSIDAFKKQVFSSTNGELDSLDISFLNPSLMRATLQPESANQPGPGAEALGMSLTLAHAAPRRSHRELTINCGPQARRPYHKLWIAGALACAGEGTAPLLLGVTETVCCQTCGPRRNKSNGV